MSSVNLQHDLLGKIAFSNSGDHTSHLCGRLSKIIDKRINGINLGPPETSDHAYRSPLCQLAFFAYNLANSDNLVGDALVQADDVIEYLRYGSHSAIPKDRQTN